MVGTLPESLQRIEALVMLAFLDCMSVHRHQLQSRVGRVNLSETREGKIIDQMQIKCLPSGVTHFRSVICELGNHRRRARALQSQ